ncbi:hypothetical protein ACIXOC_20690, partial [Bacteroides fragilis]
KLSLITPMVLRNSGRVGSRRFFRWFIPFGRKTGGDDLFYTGGGGKGAPGCPPDNTFLMEMAMGNPIAFSCPI